MQRHDKRRQETRRNRNSSKEEEFENQRRETQKLEREPNNENKNKPKTKRREVNNGIADDNLTDAPEKPKPFQQKNGLLVTHDWKWNGKQKSYKLSLDS